MINNVRKKPVNDNSFLMKIVKQARLVIVPHKKNDYRPHLIRRYGIIAIIFTVIGLQIGYNSTTKAAVLGAETEVTIASLVEQTNQTRLKYALPKLTNSAKLNQAAFLKAQDMFADQYWSHNAPDGTMPWKWLGDVGYDYNQAGENLAMNYATTSDIMKAWMNSPEHKSNVLNANYQEVGFAIVNGVLNDKPATIVVALYALPAQVAGASTQKTFTEADTNSESNFLTKMSSGFYFITPAAMAGLAIVAFAVIVSASAHTYRDKLPKKMRKSWYRHHGIIKIFILAFVGLMVVYFCNGGQT